MNDTKYCIREFSDCTIKWGHKYEFTRIDIIGEKGTRISYHGYGRTIRKDGSYFMVTLDMDERLFNDDNQLFRARTLDAAMAFCRTNPGPKKGRFKVSPSRYLEEVLELAETREERHRRTIEEERAERKARQKEEDE